MMRKIRPGQVVIGPRDHWIVLSYLRNDEIIGRGGEIRKLAPSDMHRRVALLIFSPDGDMKFGWTREVLYSSQYEVYG